MKKILLALTALIVTSSAAAQVSLIQTTPRRGIGPSEGFTIGPRYSNYSTDIDVEIITIESGRQSAFGLVGSYRGGGLVLDFLFDHDPENGLQFTDLLPIELGRYSRDRGEFTIGWAAVPYLDIQGGVRLDSISIGGRAFGFELFDSVDLDHQALVLGVGLHTADDRPFMVYGTGRAYIGSADFGGDFLGVSTQMDTTGMRLEGGVMIPVGDTQWRVVPGFEYEYLETDNNLFRFDTNRFFINFVYKFPQ